MTARAQISLANPPLVRDYKNGPSNNNCKNLKPIPTMPFQALDPAIMCNINLNMTKKDTVEIDTYDECVATESTYEDITDVDHKVRSEINNNIKVRIISFFKVNSLIINNQYSIKILLKL